MIGYIIAAFSILSLSLGGSTWYYKSKYDDSKHFVIMAEERARIAEEHSKLIIEESDRQTEVVNEKHELEITELNNTIDRMRKQTNRSILSTLPTDTRKPEEICFTREKLDSAIQEYRNSILEIVREGANCQIDLESAKDWVEQQQTLYK